MESPAHRHWTWGVIAWVAVDLLWAGWMTQVTLPASYFAAGQPAATATSGRVYLSAEDEYALKFRRFFRFSDAQAIEDWSHLRQVALPNMNLFSDTRFAFVNNFDPFVPGRYARWMKALDAAQPAQQVEMLSLMNVTAVLQRDVTQPEGIVLRPMRSAARVSWQNCVTWVTSEESAWATVQAGLGLPFPVLVLEGSSPVKTKCEAGPEPSVLVTAEQPDRLAIEVNSAVDGYLLVADTWYPGWKMAVDGQSGDVLRANYLFRGLAVPAGKHRVELYYQPESLFSGAVLSGVALLVMILWTRLIKNQVQ
jgi:hypothetical protein